MFRTLYVKEIRDNLFSLRFGITVVLCLTLLPLAFYINLKDYQNRLNSYQKTVQLYEQTRPRARHLVDGAQGFRQPAPLSIFSMGLEYHFPTTVHSDPHQNIRFSNDRGLDSPHSLLLGKIDLFFIVSMVISLLALLFTFNAVSGEKEMGTLKLSLANPVPRTTVILAKFAGNFTVLLIPFFLGLLTGFLILALSGSVRLFSSPVLPLFLMMVAGSLLLLGVFFNLGLLVSSLTHRSSTSVVILLLLWVFLALAFPRISTMIAEGVIPTRSDMVVHLEKTIKQDEILDSQEKELEDIWREISGSDNLWVPISSDSTEWNPQVRMFWDRKTEIEKRYQERVDTDLGRIDQEHLNRKQRQAGLAMSLSRLSPVSCYAYAMSELAGTGLSEETMLKNDARRFHRDVKDRVYSKVYEIQFRSSHSRSYGSFGEGHVPRYAETSDSLSDRIASAGMDLFLLCLYNLILLTAAYVAFLRYDVR